MEECHETVSRPVALVVRWAMPTSCLGGFAEIEARVEPSPELSFEGEPVEVRGVEHEPQRWAQLVEAMRGAFFETCAEGVLGVGPLRALRMSIVRARVHPVDSRAPDFAKVTRVALVEALHAAPRVVGHPGPSPGLAPKPSWSRWLTIVSLR